MGVTGASSLEGATAAALLQAQEVAQLAINAREAADAARARLEGARTELAAAAADRERLGAEQEALQREALAAELVDADAGQDGAAGASSAVTGARLEPV